MSTRPFFDARFDPTGDDVPAVGGSGDNCACGFAADAAGDGAYNEAAFHYFLDIERRRAGAFNQPFVLLLVDIEKPSAEPMEIDVSSAQKLMSALAECVRETDFIGWYRQGSIAGAVLTQHSDTAGSDLQQAISRRVAQVLRDRLPSNLALALRVRVYLLPSAFEMSEIC